MDYYVVRPEVAGGIGANTVLDRRSHPPSVSKLHYEFEGWLGDELLETFPCFIVTQRIANLIETRRFTGVDFASVEITTSDTFEEIYPGRVLPPFVWLKITGTAGKDDFGLSRAYRLVLSDRALRTMDLKHCDVDEFLE